MRRVPLGFVLLAVVTLTSCIPSVQYTERLIRQPELRNFGLAGEWQWTPQSADINSKEVVSATIEGPDSTGTYRVHLAGEPDTKISFVATRLNSPTNHAIVEMDVQEGQLAVGRYLAYALAEGDQLTVWWLDAKRLPEAFKAERAFAVIENGLGGTSVTADPPDMLRVLRNRSTTLAGKPTLFRRVSPSAGDQLNRQ